MLTAISHGAPFVVEPGAYIKGYRQLSALRVGFYPIHRDKSPAVHGKLNRVATVDPIKIRFWADHCHHRGFAARLLTGCRIVVIDTEDPFKHPDRPGPDGELILGSLLEDTDTILPPCPFLESSHRWSSGGPAEEKARNTAFPNAAMFSQTTIVFHGSVNAELASPASPGKKCWHVIRFNDLGGEFGITRRRLRVSLPAPSPGVAKVKFTAFPPPVLRCSSGRVNSAGERVAYV